MTRFKDFLFSLVDSGPARTDLGWPGILLVAFLAFAVALPLNNYTFGIGDHWHYLAFINKIENPRLYPGDILFDSMPAHHSYFLSGLALISSEANRAWWFFVIHCLVSFASAIFLYRIGLKVTKNRLAALVFLLFFIRPGYGLGISQSFLKQDNFAFPFLLASLELFLSRRYLPAFFLAGLMLNIQGQYAFYFLFVYALALLPELNQLGFKGVAKIVLAALIGSLPVFFRGDFFSARHLSPEQLSLYFQIARCRVNGSVAVLHWGYDKWQPLMLALAAAGFCWLRKDCRKEIDSRILWLAPPVILLMLAGIILVEIFPVHPFFLQLMLFRSAPILILILLSYASVLVARLMGEDSWLRNIFGASWLIILSLFHDQTSRLILISIFILIPATLIFFLVTQSRGLIKSLAPARTILILILFSVLLLYTLLEKGSLLAPFHRDIEPDWLEVQLWARNNTPINTLFLTPYNQQGFRVYSRRSALVEWKDGAPLTYAPVSLIEWWRRMEKLGYKLNLKTEEIVSPESVSPETILEMAEQYHTSYIIVSKLIQLGLQPAFQNSSYQIYQFSSPPEKEGKSLYGADKNEQAEELRRGGKG